MAAGGVVDVYLDVWGGGTGGCIHEVGLIQGRRGEYIFMYEVVLYIYMVLQSGVIPSVREEKLF